MSLYVEGDVPYVANSNGNNGGWNDWSWIIGLAVVGGIFGNGGWGFGGGGNRGGGFGYGYPFAYGAPATQADLAAGFNNSAVLSSLNDIKLGQQQAINYNNQGFAGLNSSLASGFAGVQQTLCQGFNGVDRAIADTNYNIANSVCTLGYNTQAGFNSLANQLASCCCDLKTMNLENRYLNEKQTSDIVSAITAGNQRLVDIYTNDKIASLTAENTALKGQISNDRQSAYITDTILDRLSPCPKPAYLTCNPNAPYGLGYGVPFASQSGCGFGCN